MINTLQLPVEKLANFAYQVMKVRLNCVVLCCVVLCCVVLCCVALRCVALRCVVLRCVVLLYLFLHDIYFDVVEAAKWPTTQRPTGTPNLEGKKMNLSSK